MLLSGGLGGEGFETADSVFSAPVLFSEFSFLISGAGFLLSVGESGCEGESDSDESTESVPESVSGGKPDCSEDKTDTSELSGGCDILLPLSFIPRKKPTPATATAATITAAEAICFTPGGVILPHSGQRCSLLL